MHSSDSLPPAIPSDSLQSTTNAPPPIPTQPEIQSPGIEPALVPTEYRFSFRGDAKEYFRIWIVNIALTILTLGIYSAWAKVRTSRYFYGNTWVAGVPFEFLAKPIPILIGRIIGFILFGSYTLATQIAVQWAWIPLLIILAIFPWLIVRGLKFRARYSSWATQTFRFVGTTKKSYTYFLFAPLLLLPTLGLIFPIIQRWQKGFVVDHHRFGGKQFKLNADIAAFYIPYLIGMAVMMGVMIVAGVLMVAIMAAVFGVGGEKAMENPQTALYFMLPMIILMYGGYFAVWIFVQTRITNTIFNTTQIDAHKLRSTLRARDLMKIYLTNTLAIVASLGLMIPWAMVRASKYRAENLSLLVQGDLSSFVTEAKESESATGAEVGDFFDVDIGL